MHHRLRFAVAATLLLLLFSAPPAHSMSSGEQTDLYRAQQAAAAGKPDRAADILKKYIKHHRAPAAELYLALGNLFQDSGDTQRAEKMYRRGLKIHPQALSLLQNLAIICYEDHRFKESGTLFAQAASLKQNNGDLRYQAAAAYYQGGEYENALAVLRGLVTQHDHPRDEWLRLLIHVCLDTEEFELAEHTLCSFLTLHPDRKPYWKLLSRIHLDRKQYQKAASAMAVALTLPGAENEEWRELGNLYLWIDAPLEAAACYEKGLGRDPKPERLDRVAECYARAGRPNKSCDALDRAIATQPTLNRMLRKARVRYRSGEYEKCIAASRACLQLSADSAEAHFLAGSCAMALSRWREAGEFFRGALLDTRFNSSARYYLRILEDWKNGAGHPEDAGK